MQLKRLSRRIEQFMVLFSVLQCIAVCCSVLQFIEGGVGYFSNERVFSVESSLPRISSKTVLWKRNDSSWQLSMAQWRLSMAQWRHCAMADAQWRLPKTKRVSTQEKSDFGIAHRKYWSSAHP